MTMRVVPQFNLSVLCNFSVVDLSSADSYLDFLLTPDHMHGGSIYHASLWVSPTNNGIGTRRMRVVRTTQPRSDTFAAAMAVHAGQVQADFLRDESYPLPPSYSTSGASHHMLPYGDLYADDYEPSEVHRRSMCTYTAGADYMEAEISIPTSSQSLLQLLRSLYATPGLPATSCRLIPQDLVGSSTLVSPYVDGARINCGVGMYFAQGSTNAEKLDALATAAY